MKTEELKPCACCGKGVMHDGSPMFYRVRMEPHIVDMAAVQRRHGEELMMGAMAGVLGVNDDIAKPIDGTQTVALVCMSCMTSGKPMAMLLEGD